MTAALVGAGPVGTAMAPVPRWWRGDGCDLAPSAHAGHVMAGAAARRPPGSTRVIYLTLLAGFVLLVAGGESLVRGAVALARRLGVSPLLIGLTLVGFGTSSPELVTSLQAAWIGSPGIAVGNVVGSNIANILLILAVAGLIRPLATSRQALTRDGAVMTVAALLCLLVVLQGSLSWPLGAVFVVALVAYVVGTYLIERRTHDASARMHEAEAEAVAPQPHGVLAATAFTVGGLVLTIVGARLLVTAAVELAAAAGISETIVGLTVVAVGTSLPELVTSVVAALRRQGDVAFGNVIGSNIYNVLGILGITALVHPIPVPPEIARLDIWVMLAATLLLVVFAWTGQRLDRRESAVALSLYVLYVGYLASIAGSPAAAAGAAGQRVSRTARPGPHPARPSIRIRCPGRPGGRKRAPMRATSPSTRPIGSSTSRPRSNASGSVCTTGAF